MNLAEKKQERKILAMGCFTEMGERYVFYTLQSLLIFYLIDHLHLSHMSSAKLAGTVFGMVYISALLGGYIAESLLSYYYATLIGTIVLTLGSWIMVSAYTENTLFIGLAFISIGSGLIKSNISSFIGKFYDKVKARESQRDFGFSIFYMGINAGIIFATYFAMNLRDRYGFNGAFYTSIMVSFLVFLITVIGYFLSRKYQNNKKISIKSLFLSFLCIAGYIGFIVYLLKNPYFANATFTLVSALCVLIMIISAKSGQMHRSIAAMIFFILSTLYWSLYMQLFISLLLFLHYCVIHQVMGFSVNASQFVTIESFSVLLFGFFIGKIWIYFEKKNKPIHDIDKFSLSFLLIGAMYVVIYLAIDLSPAAERIAAWPIIISVFFMGASELTLSAIGLSMVTKIAPKGYVSIYMGIWLVTIGLGSKLAGEISSYIPVNSDILTSKISTSHGLLWLIALSCAGVVFALLVRKSTIKMTS
jgi:POT family proton-dependent oligopeptide transporter